MRWLKLLIAAGLTVALFFFANKKIGQVPPPGKFLNPFAGFWQNGSHSDALPRSLAFKDMVDTVTVVWDARKVPHIFAENTWDLYFTQGYLMARDRLWQMDFITRAATGRLSEIIGSQALEYDRFRRRIGMVYAAEQALQAMQEDAKLRSIGEAYAAGVNAWIRNLGPADWPLEFKILDYKPEAWTPFKSAIVLKYMAWMLTGRFREKRMTRTREMLSEAVMNRLFPRYPPLSEPVIPPGTPWHFAPERIPLPPAAAGNAAAPAVPGEPMLLGSNNWALSGTRTENGHAILCNDPHLGLNLPSIWYEMQLAAPGLNVYGVTLPGSPGIIIGFNNHIAWGVTNAASDVLDWYRIQFKDESCREYFYDGQWRPTQMRIEKIRVRGREAVRDTVFYTHYGPVVYRSGEKPYGQNIPLDAAMRWTGHDPSREIAAFIKLNRARNYGDYLDALADYDCPAQNFAYADVEGNIAMRHNGKFPLRWKGQGRFLMDGSDPANAWAGWIPHDQVPQVKNPPRGFVSSANQVPADSTYPYYLGWSWQYASFERSVRINEMLRATQNATPQDMMRLQLDVLNLRARALLPILLDALPVDSLSGNERRAYDELVAWNYENRAGLIAPLVFRSFWNQVYQSIWRDELAPQHLGWPGTDVSIDVVLHHQQSPYIDNRATPKRETLADWVLPAFRRTIADLTKAHGLIGPRWQWGKARGTDIRHLARIPGLGRTRLRTSGDFAIVNATNRHAGPSWRMIVELVPGKVRARGIYPGGQSGNPGSPEYDRFVDDWVAGNYYELLFLQSPDEKQERLISRTLLRGKK